MKGGNSRQQAGMIRAHGRKRHNRAIREDALKAEAERRGIPLHELKQEQFEVVQDLRKYPPSKPGWLERRGW